MAENKANLILIKRSSTTAAPSQLAYGELAYSFLSPGGDKLFIGSSDGTPVAIGGKHYTDYVDNLINTYLKPISGESNGIQLGSGSTFINDGDTSLQSFVESIADSKAEARDNELTLGIETSEATGSVNLAGASKTNLAFNGSDQITVTLGTDGLTFSTAVKLATSDELANVESSLSQSITDAVAEALGDWSGETVADATKAEIVSALGFQYSNGDMAEDQKVTVQSKLDALGQSVEDALTEAKQYASDAVAALGDVYNVKGSKATYEDLKAIPVEELHTGDVYNVIASVKIGDDVYPAGTNWVWVSSKDPETAGSWDALGGTYDLSDMASATTLNKVITELRGDGEGLDGPVELGLKARMETAEADIDSIDALVGLTDPEATTSQAYKIQSLENTVNGYTKPGETEKTAGLVDRMMVVETALGVNEDNGNDGGNLVGRLQSIETFAYELRNTVLGEDGKGGEGTLKGDFQDMQKIIGAEAVEGTEENPGSAATGLIGDVRELQENLKDLKIDDVVKVSGQQTVKDKRFENILAMAGAVPTEGSTLTSELQYFIIDGGEF